MLGKRLINSNDAAAGGSCTTNTNDYPTTNVAYYKMSSAADEKGTYNGTATDVNFNVAGKFGNAAGGFAYNKYITFPDLGGFTSNTSDADGALSIWFNLNSIPATSSNFYSLIDRGNPNSFSSTYQALELTVFGTSNANEVTFNLRRGFSGTNYDASSYSSTATTLTANAWYNLVVSYVASTKTATFYLNENSIGSYSLTVSSSGRTIDSGFNIGSYGNSSSYSAYAWDGLVDQVRIFSSALDATQVESLYNEVYCVPTIVPTDNFNTVLYTGDDTNTSYTRDITGVGFDPDFVWIKDRDNGVFEHALFDSVRGAGASKILSSDSTGAEGWTTAAPMSAFITDGFSVQPRSPWNANNLVNKNGEDFVAWNWKAGGAAVSNTDGSITSQVSANVDAGFSIVEYSGTNSVTDTVGHGLSETPEMVIVKNTSASKSWAVRHAVLASTQNIFLNATNGATTITATATGGVGVINSTTFGFAAGGTNASNVNISGNDFIAYAFHSVDGYSRIGSYKGNGSATGPTVVTGFRPAFVMIKRTDVAANWRILDNKRSTTNPINKELYPPLSNAEGTFSALDFLSNGFQIINTDGSYNSSIGTYIFMAFAEEGLPIVTRNATNPFGDSSELALYKFEDNANDAEGNYNGTASNVTYASGYIDKAAVFNGLQTSSASYIDISSATTTPVSSISFWFKTTVKNSTNANILAAGGSSSTRTGFSIRRNSSGFLNVQFTKGTPGSTQTVTGNQDITDGVWHNFILSMASDNTFVVYLDGQSHISGTRTHFTNGQSRSQSINRFGSDSVAIGANAFDGSIDQVRIFDRALDDGEVTALYNE